VAEAVVGGEEAEAEAVAVALQGVAGGAPAGREAVPEAAGGARADQDQAAGKAEATALWAPVVRPWAMDRKEEAPPVTRMAVASGRRLLHLRPPRSCGADRARGTANI
jgi:hypothetical protein